MLVFIQLWVEVGKNTPLLISQSKIECHLENTMEPISGLSFELIETT